MVVETAMGTGRKTRETKVVAAVVAVVVATESRPDDA
jgi:hypothetical protein